MRNFPNRVIQKHYGISERQSNKNERSISSRSFLNVLEFQQELNEQEEGSQEVGT